MFGDAVHVTVILSRSAPRGAGLWLLLAYSSAKPLGPREALQSKMRANLDPGK